MMAYFAYWAAMVRYAVIGPPRYYLWLSLLSSGVVMGAIAYGAQLEYGLVVTHLSDQVSWGAYIANFTFLVGVAAAAVLLVVPSYVYQRKDIREVVIIGELMAVAAIVMCLAFVTVDLGRPDRLWHLLPGLGRLNFPRSVLAWDVIVLAGYLVLNLHIPGYVLYRRYRGARPTPIYYWPLALISIGWAVSIHTVTAFLYSGLGGRPIWNTAILAPRFLVSAFASGPSLLILALTVLRLQGLFTAQASAFVYLRRVVSFMLPLNLFLLGCEVFTEFYTDSSHSLSARYLYLGLYGRGMLTPYIWTALAMEALALAVLLTPRLRERPRFLQSACVLCILGIWVEKGMGLIIPGFIPSPAGDLVEYAPSLPEFWISIGIWCLGALLFTLSVRVAVAIQTGALRAGPAPDFTLFRRP